MFYIIQGKMRKILFIILGVFLLTGCIPTTTNQVTFSFQKTNYSLAVGATERLYPTITNLTETPSVVYASSNTSVVVIEQVEDYHVLRAIGAGNALVTAILNNVEGKVVTLAVNVSAASNNQTLEISIVGNALVTVEVGASRTFTITSNIAYTETLVWSSSDTSIGTISNTGVFSALDIGSTTITATVGSATDQVIVNVVEAGSIAEPTAITIYGDTTVAVGETLALTVVPDVTGSYAVTWSSINTSVATVSSTGLVTGVAVGTVAILATLTDYPSVTETITIDVVSSAVNPTGLTLEGDSTVDVGSSVSLTAIIIPTGATGTVIYSSSDDEIATVSSTGLVTGVAAGVVTITATLEENSLISNTFEITVNSGTLELQGITVTGPNEVQAGLKITLEAVPFPLGAPMEVTWASLATSKATVDEFGEVTGVSVGIATITATSTSDGQIMGYKNITITAGPAITASVTSNSLYIGETVTVTGTVTNSTNTAVTYTSSNELVATVNETTGVVTGVSAGTVTIMAIADVLSNLVASVTITVNPLPTISISPASATINQTETVTVAATITNSSNTAATYASSNTGVATVNATTGVVTGVSQGTATITATAAIDSNLQATMTVTVNSNPTISVSPTTATLSIGGTQQLTATVANLTNKNVTWASSTTGVATVNSSGLVTAVAAGSATITATSASVTSLKATATITVNPTSYTLSFTLNSGSWTWTTGSVTIASGINAVSDLPEKFMVDIYKYLKDNSLLSASTVNSTLRKTTWATFSSNYADPVAIYNWTSTNTSATPDGYSQFFWTTISGTTATGGFFGTEPYKSKYVNLLYHLTYMFPLKYATSDINTEGGKALVGFILDGYFYGTQSTTGTTNDTAFQALRGKIPTPILRWNSTGTTSSATTYQVSTYAFGQVGTLKTPFRAGYFFSGWYNNSGFTGSPITTVPAGTAPASMYYAKWTAAS